MSSLRIHRNSPGPGVAELGMVEAPEAGHGCRVCLVRHLAVCTALPADQASALEQLTGDTRLHAGELLAREGDLRRYVFTVQTGALRRTRTLADGRRLVAGFLMPGDYIGFSSATHYRHTIEAITDSTLCAVSHEGMRTLCATYHGLEHELMQRACIELDATRDKLMALARMTPPERLAGFLLDMVQRRQRQGLDDAVVALPMTRTDIADYLGLTIETVSRCFTKLRGEGLIATPDPHTVQLLDRKKLELLAAAA
ncbi:CRP/FNR family transcriptional regulator, anaerobic regulatory protein [Pseudoxanthomonas sp. GM95]|uniref:Crp/Fnr family transcriptional regulator n=1 Tax=Pseudoxanthomonas sp. GM95 TaxID=1881043 RepID=UPI0008C98036|nr:helix-turn-helix domain-containing protein [Pseudoxanthomonas sp. GM95]SEL47899.1 CRP/FNR family transcriptional regulator, anaerobic regulatory protein [Pseudoxanthomonas sp. GM95]